jgi:hypothetical protein
MTRVESAKDRGIIASNYASKPSEIVSELKCQVLDAINS